MSPRRRARATFERLRDESVRKLAQSEKAMERSFNEGRLLASLAVGLLLVGFLLVAQWRGNQSFARDIERQSDQDLAVIIGELTAENAALRDEVIELEVRVLEAERDTKGTSALLEDAAEELEALRVTAGLVAAAGPGVIVRIEDPERVLLAQDFVALVHELRAAGAEAVAIEGRRVTGTSGFADADGGILLDGRVLEPGGYLVEAIGDPGTLAQALSMPGGVESRFATFPGVTTQIEPAEDLQLAAASGRDFAFGRAAGEE